jgi:hypothetical protein
MLVVAFLDYWLGLSLDHVCEVLEFFTGLELSSSTMLSCLLVII